MQLTPHQPITIPSINLQPRTSTFDWYVYRGQVMMTIALLRAIKQDWAEEQRQQRELRRKMRTLVQ